MELYRDARQPVDVRVEDLISRMTLAEKLGQLQMKLFGWQCYRKAGDDYELTETLFDEVTRCQGLGGLYGLFRADPWSGVGIESGIPLERAAEISNKVQAYVLAHSRLGIPVLLAEECPHGLQGIDGVVYPTNLGAACSFDPEARRDNFEHAARELRARGAHMALASTLDLLSDPRWGRSEECYGEDPYLARCMTEAVTRGLQGDTPEQLRSGERVAAMLKHYAGQGSAVGGHNGGPSNVGEREMRELHLPAMRAGCAAGAQSVMASYSSIDGVPCHAHRALLTQVLREEMGFDGFVLSDGGGVDGLTRLTGGQLDKDDSLALARAAALALNAGVDMALWGRAFDHLEEALRLGLTDLATVDEAVRRVLRVKFRLGLFDQPYADPERIQALPRAQAHASALRMARESLVLIKNEGGLLPLSPERGRIALIGPNADCLYNQLGDYVAAQRPGVGVTPLAGVRALASGAEILYARGCGIRDRSTAGFEEAVDAARRADVAVLVLGGSSTRDFDTQIDEHGAVVVGGSMEMNCGEGVDVSSLELDGVQLELFERVRETGTPVVAVLIQGRPHAIETLHERCPAILAAWYPGIEGGTAIAEALFGRYNPGGKLACSIARSVGQLPVNYNRHLPYPAAYLDGQDAPRYGFGYGLSYTHFELSDLTVDREISRSALLAGGRVEVAVTVRNAGSRLGDEVVQLYLRALESSVCRRVWELKGFERVTLAPGEARRVRLSLSARDLMVWDVSMREALEPGRLLIRVTNGVQPPLDEIIRLE